jgi:predicted alpha/beta superfamily hydrolase
LKTIKPVSGSGRLWLIINLLVFLSCTGYHSFAQQHHLRITIKSVPSSHPVDSLYVAGSFNEWNPGLQNYVLTKTVEGYKIDIPGLAEQDYQFKFTRGSWSREEANINGSKIENRTIKLISDTTIECNIEAWSDDIKQKEKQHTASINVQVLDTSFFIPQLNRTRKIWLYLPEGYDEPKNKKRYPVMYFQDGQNIFDEYTSAYGEWGVDECLDTMIRNGKQACIVVGIESGNARINEYNAYDNEEYGKGEGVQYVNFLVQSLKPFIDEHYRTLTSKENTIIAGSSMGALISCYALLTHPEVFGKAGIFSPSFWIAPAMEQLVDSVAPAINAKIFFYIGGAEGDKHVKNMERIAEYLGGNSKAIIYTLIDPAGNHNEQAWRKWFAEFYIWSIADGFNCPVNINK